MISGALIIPNGLPLQVESAKRRNGGSELATVWMQQYLEASIKEKTAVSLNFPLFTASFRLLRSKWVGCLQSICGWHILWVGESFPCSSQCSGSVLSTAARRLGYTVEYLQARVVFWGCASGRSPCGWCSHCPRVNCKVKRCRAHQQFDGLLLWWPFCFTHSPKKVWLLLFCLLCNLTHCFPVHTHSTPVSNFLACAFSSRAIFIFTVPCFPTLSILSFISLFRHTMLVGVFAVFVSDFVYHPRCISLHADLRSNLLRLPDRP